MFSTRVVLQFANLNAVPIISQVNVIRMHDQFLIHFLETPTKRNEVYFRHFYLQGLPRFSHLHVQFPCITVVKTILVAPCHFHHANFQEFLQKLCT